MKITTLIFSLGCCHLGAQESLDYNKAVFFNRRTKVKKELSKEQLTTILKILKNSKKVERNPNERVSYKFTPLWITFSKKGVNVKEIGIYEKMLDVRGYYSLSKVDKLKLKKLIGSLKSNSD